MFYIYNRPQDVNLWLKLVLLSQFSHLQIRICGNKFHDDNANANTTPNTTLPEFSERPTVTCKCRIVFDLRCILQIGLFENYSVSGLTNHK